jgi:hypothetical protein
MGDADPTGQTERMTMYISFIFGNLINYLQCLLFFADYQTRVAENYINIQPGTNPLKRSKMIKWLESKFDLL